jgi:hypothetical protein
MLDLNRTARVVAGPLIVASAVIGWVVGLAGAFGGKRSFALGLAATTLAFVPVFLEFPDGRRAGHYIVSLLATFVAMALVSNAISRMPLGSAPRTQFADTSRMSRVARDDSSTPVPAVPQVRAAAGAVRGAVTSLMPEGRGDVGRSNAARPGAVDQHQPRLPGT